MTLADTDVDALAERLDEAERRRRDTVSIAAATKLSVADAYRVQHTLIRRRTARGETLVGVKLGFTSRAKMAQMGVSDVIVGHLTDTMRHADGDAVDLTAFIHPRIEPEIAFRLAADVDPGDPGTDIESLVDAMAPALEIIDSRYQAFRFTYTDVIADNTSAAAFVLGAWQPYENPGGRAVRLDTPSAVATGSTSAVLGDPRRALHELVTMSRRHDIRLTAGSVILAGAATEALRFEAGVTRCDIAGLGHLTVRGVA
ncbi:4-oxalocrotonate decarboxylase [Streptomyces sp. NPDC026672]|uniref:2-keto-4-pentenoate hydratase n=1 Tax=unclassified Streptomyces TaxID=2593676 RepID=UPI0033E67A04